MKLGAPGNETTEDLGMGLGAPGSGTTEHLGMRRTSNLLLPKRLHSCVRRSILCGGQTLRKFK